MKIFHISIAIAVGFCTVANAQNKSPLNSNPNNGAGGRPVRTSREPIIKQPLYTPSVFDDMPSGFANRRLTRPFTQQQYDYNKRLHFGFVVSASALDYKIISSKQPRYNSSSPDAFSYFADVTTLSPAMGVAALMDYRINHSFSLRVQAGPTFATPTINFYDADDDNKLVKKGMPLDAVLVEMSFLLKYKALRHNDVRPYMIAGLTPYCDVAAFKTFNAIREIYIAVTPFDVAFTAGMGVDMYADFFKFSLELKYVMGIMNRISPKSLEGFEQFPNSIEAMYAHSFVLSIIFE